MNQALHYSTSVFISHHRPAALETLKITVYFEWKILVMGEKLDLKLFENELSIFSSLSSEANNCGVPRIMNNYFKYSTINQ